MLPSALFNLNRGDERRILDLEIIPLRSDMEMQYTDHELDQSDAEVWLTCLRLALKVPIGQRIYTTCAELLHETSRSTGTDDHRWLKASLDRLSEVALGANFMHARKNISVHCRLLNWGLECESKRMFLRLNPEGMWVLKKLNGGPGNSVLIKRNR